MLRKTPGRPSQAKEGAKVKSTISLTPKCHEATLEAADRAKMSKNQYVETALIEKMERDDDSN